MSSLTRELTARGFRYHAPRDVTPDPLLGQRAMWVGAPGLVFAYHHGDVQIECARLPRRPTTAPCKITFNRGVPVCVITATLDAIAGHDHRPHHC